MPLCPELGTLLLTVKSEEWKPNDTMDNIEEFIATGSFNHEDKGRFTGAYYFDLQEINPFMESNGFETLSLIGSSLVLFYLKNNGIFGQIEDNPKLID